MDIKISEYLHCYLVQVSGKIDSTTAPQLVKSLEDIMSGYIRHQTPEELEKHVIYSFRQQSPDAKNKQIKGIDQKIPSECYRIALDMSEVSFASSAFLRVILSTQDNCKRYNRGDLVLAQVQPNLLSVLDLAGYTNRFQIYATPLDAVGNF